MLLDLIATNNWERPIYFASPSSVEDFINITDYCFLDGCVYRFLPVKGDARRGGVLTNETYDCLMNKFVYGNINDPTIYVDKESYGMSLYLRNNFARVAQGLLAEGQKEKALKALDRGAELLPDYAVPYDLYMIGYAELYFSAGDTVKGKEIFRIVGDIYDQNLTYYESVNPDAFKKNVMFTLNGVDQAVGFFGEDTQQGLQVLQALMSYSEKYGQKAESERYRQLLMKYIPQQAKQ